MAPILETRDVSKRFGAVQALRSVSFALNAGEVHGLVGENGAGKSTLIKILTGFYQPDGGAILLGGEPVHFDSPRASQRLGVSAVYQEINLIPERSVAENVFLGHEPKRFGVLIDRKRMDAEADELLRRYDLKIDPRARLGALGLGLQQMVSIARGVRLGARVVILDEPSSALTGAEVETLFRAVDRLKADGIAILFVSHRLSECYRLCDRLTVLRDGSVVASAATAELPRAALIGAMLGRSAESIHRVRPARVPREATPALETRGLRWRTRVRDVSFAVRPGEVVGLAGLLGAGRTETMKASFGAETKEAGEVRIAGGPVASPTPGRSIAAGLAFLSEDRRAEGIFPKLSVAENLAATALPALARFGFISRKKQDAMVARFTRALGIKAAGPGAPITSLSGGNQQKVLLARCLATAPRAIMLDDPTRGIDVGAKAEVHEAIHLLVEDGLGVLVTSSEMEELMALADRLVVLNEGAVSGALRTEGAAVQDVLDMLAAPHEDAPA
ncbi:sugar ABC transporter ATP-binding protein [Acidiphilium sp. AL]|uniref:Sugar ABC transporter ATP-binding protein n=1 Tax=Acidiphilium iwatense TaxID=768198 RepID=A0ABS9DUK9_9PROT|nr:MULTISPECIES: sugar ABC transporter ATP-binding protein [Acidiphilium]MCF3946389.1 sugar ABC transporter ATP-binding protein [Acidiphilium iwatense]MCU4159828.1 sugar ABC transporter ATP-binding protein [Acidiphilium sp. AL]